MKQEFEFDNIGKKLPYSVPDKFFENNVMQIIQETSKRERNNKLRKMIYSTLAFASSIALIISVYVFVNKENRIKEMTASQQAVPTVMTSQNEAVLSSKNESSINSSLQAVSNKSDLKSEVVQKNDSVDELLASLSDEELEQMMIGVENDPFLENQSY